MSEVKKTTGQKVVHEIKEILNVTLYFAVWLGILMLLKKLLLADYNIEFKGVSIVLISSLIIAKVVLLMDLIPLGMGIKKHPVYVDVIVRTLWYTFGVLIVSLLEKAFESRNENGGFSEALQAIFQHRDIYKVWANTLVVGLSIFWFQVWRSIKSYLKNGELVNLFFKTPLEELELKQKSKTA